VAWVSLSSLAEYLLTDRRQFDILLCGHGSLGSDAIRSTTSARFHHGARQRGGLSVAWTHIADLKKVLEVDDAMDTAPAQLD
jgi:hypothetical protein